MKIKRLLSKKVTQTYTEIFNHSQSKIVVVIMPVERRAPHGCQGFSSVLLMSESKVNVSIARFNLLRTWLFFVNIHTHYVHHDNTDEGIY